ncbi:MAG: Na+/H+ antiporter NhaA [Desulfobacula sp.]|nr:Na+/H+ antiporter NhaA [Desulfobacula sp.]
MENKAEEWPGELNPLIRLGKRVQEEIAEFMHLEISGSIVLLVATAIAMILANSSLADPYFAVWQTKVGIKIGNFEFFETILHWVNDFLMAIFFFVVSLEIKRELIVGELSSLRKATLPLAAAAGGMAAPALIYAFFNAGGPAADGWGVPMATDIAFALGVAALLGRRIPGSLKIFIVALAIGDDIGAILVIALFYTHQILWEWLAIAGVLIFVLFIFNIIGFNHLIFYGLIAMGVWFAIFESGVHATVAGVLVAFAIPAQARRLPLEFVNRSRKRLDHIERTHDPNAHDLNRKEQQTTAAAVQSAAGEIQSPLLRLEHNLHPLTSFVILPLFALANAGVQIGSGNIFEILGNPVGLGIILGLVVGKQAGITLLSFLAVKLGLANLPTGVSWKHIYGASWLTGIGFTMSIFISALAFTGDPAMLDSAKLAILTASIIAGAGGYVFLFLTHRPKDSAS